MRHLTFILFLVSSISSAAAAPRIFSGFDYSFSKAAFDSPTLPANQDRLTDDVILTRDNTRGLFNIAQEAAYVDFLSPAGTLWAFPHNNPSASISASNWAALSFTDWQTAFGSSGGGGPQGTIGQNSVVHLVADDIYLDLRLTEWGIGSGAGGSFAYERATIIPEPTSALMLLSAILLLKASRRRRS